MVNPEHPKLKRFGDKHRDYFRFAYHLVNEGDFLITHALPIEDREWFRRKALWWAQRNNKVIKTEVIYVPAIEGYSAGRGIKVTLTRNYRYKRA